MELKFILESILFSAQHPLNAKELKDLLGMAAEQTEDMAVKAFKKTSTDEITAALEQIEKEHAGAGRSYRLACVAGAWQFFSQPEFAPWIKALVGQKNRPGRLSQPALETLAILAYRQPLTRAEIEQVRGVAVEVHGLGTIARGVGELILAVLAQVADMERTRINERTAAGRATPRACKSTYSCVAVAVSQQ